MNKKEFINDIILNGFNTSIILHNYASPIESELTILPLLTAFNSWIETTDECDDEITPDDICVITQYLKNPDILTLTDKAKENFEKIHEEIYDQSENGIPINSGSEKTLLRILEIYNNDYYKEYIKPHLVSNKDDLRFKKVLEILKNEEIVYEIDENTIYSIINTYRSKISFEDYLNIEKYIKKYNSINIKERILLSDLLEEKFITLFINKYHPDFEEKRNKEIECLSRIDINDNFNLSNIHLKNYISPNGYIDFDKLGKDLRKIIAFTTGGKVEYFMKDSYVMYDNYYNTEIKYRISSCSKIELINSLKKIKYEYMKNNNKYKITLDEILFDNERKLEKYIGVKGKSFYSKDNNFLSVFTGFKFRIFNPSDNDLKKINPFFVHIKKVLSNNDNNVYEYLLNWLAFIVQNPGEKTGVCNVFIDGGGSGKTLFMEIIALLFNGFSDYSCQKMDCLVGDFNAYLENKIFICCNEVKKEDNFRRNYDSEEFIILSINYIF